MARLLEAAPSPKYKAAMSAGYSAGLRVSEVVALKVADVDSKRMLLRIDHTDQAQRMLANRASTWPRDHFCRSTIAPR
jgi:site-specific recombinase XerD